MHSVPTERSIPEHVFDTAGEAREEGMGRIQYFHVLLWSETPATFMAGLVVGAFMGRGVRLMGCEVPGSVA